MPAATTTVAAPPLLELASMIRAYKLDHGLTLDELGQQFAVSHSTIGRILTAKIAPTRFPEHFLDRCGEILGEEPMQRLALELESLLAKNRSLISRNRSAQTTARNRSAAAPIRRDNATVHKSPGAFTGARILLHTGEIGVLDLVLITPTEKRRGVVRFNAGSYWRAVFLEDIDRVLDERTDG